MMRRFLSAVAAAAALQVGAILVVPKSWGLYYLRPFYNLAVFITRPTAADGDVGNVLLVWLVTAIALYSLLLGGVWVLLLRIRKQSKKL